MSLDRAEMPKDLAEANEIIRHLRSELAAVCVAVGRSDEDGYDVDWFGLANDVAALNARVVPEGGLTDAEADLVNLWAEYKGGHIGGSEFNDMVCDVIAEKLATGKKLGASTPGRS